MATKRFLVVENYEGDINTYSFNNILEIRNFLDKEVEEYVNENGCSDETDIEYDWTFSIFDTEKTIGNRYELVTTIRPNDCSIVKTVKLEYTTIDENALKRYE